jgi:hypothetical protein
MKKLFIVGALVLLLGASCSSVKSTNNNANVQASANVPAASVKFADQLYYKNAYLISGPTMDAKTKEATTGFDIIKRALPDGATEYSLKALKSEYKDQVYTLKPGEQLYFIENFMGDDDVTKNEEKGFRDDMAVVVDANGNVVGDPALWTK